VAVVALVVVAAVVVIVSVHVWWRMIGITQKKKKILDGARWH